MLGSGKRPLEVSGRRRKVIKEGGKKEGMREGRKQKAKNLHKSQIDIMTQPETSSGHLDCV